MFTRRRFFLGILFTVVFITGAQAATLHGTIYEWSDFDNPLKNTWVEVNSTPVQKVLTTGTYSFNLAPGSYLIKARYYHNDILEYTADEEIQIDKEGNFTHDLLLFPPTDSEYEHLGDINLTSSMDIKSEYNPSYYIIIILILALSALMLIYWIKKKKSIAIESIKDVTLELPPENVAEITHMNFPKDLRELYELILKKGGRTTQKELRKDIKYSEAKVSLMLDDLENRGFIKKIKKGRANIIISEFKK